MAKIELSIIIVSYNTKNITKNCIDSIVNSLKNSEIKYEIVVVDNNSKDGSIEMLKNLESRIKNLKLTENKENLGFGKGNNVGVKKAKGKYILLLNSDTVVLDNAIERLLKYYKDQNMFNFLGGKLLNEDRSPQPSAAPFYKLIVVFVWLFLKGDSWGATRSSPDKITATDWVSGACILTTKDKFNELRGFDEGVFMYMEEVDLLYRAKQKGFKVGFYPKAQFIHLGSASSRGRTYPIIQTYNGLLYFYKKHHSKMALSLLKFLLELKALISWGFGKLTGNQYLIETYGKAYKMVAQDR